MDWQPIETAPKDGTRVMVWNAVTGSYITAFEPPKFAARGLWPMRGWGEHDGTWYPEPTHWQRLPNPPAAVTRRDRHERPSATDQR